MPRASPWDNDELLREELFSIERLEQHAASLAVAQQVTAHPPRRPPLGVRLTENESVLLGAYRSIAKAAGEGRAITPAAEWLLDNYHLVEAQIREIREDLPPGFYRLLPKLAHGPFMGYPRVFGIAWAFVAHTDSHFDPDCLLRFVRAYQAVQPLTIGELWAVAITLRIVLVENMRRAAQRIVDNRTAREQAGDIADRLLGAHGNPAEPDALLRSYNQGTRLPATSVVELVQRLRDQDPKVTPALKWLEERLAKQGTTVEAVVSAEHLRQGSSNVTVRNIITSMRLISELEWSEFFESASLVDEALRDGSDFAQMDFATRNLYRSSIEELSRGSNLTEIEIAHAALAAGRAAGDVDRLRDPGYHLVGAGSPCIRVGDRLPGTAAAGTCKVDHAARCAAVCGGNRLRRRRRARCRAARAVRSRHRRLAPGAAWRARTVPGAGCVGRIRQSRGNDCLPRDDPARTRAPGRRAAAISHAARRSHAAHYGRIDRRGDRAAGDPLPLVARRRDPFRTAVGLGRFGVRTCSPGRGARRERGRGHRAAESQVWARPCGRPIPPAAPPAGVERRAAAVDGMGAQARQVA